MDKRCHKRIDMCNGVNITFYYSFSLFYLKAKKWRFMLRLFIMGCAFHGSRAEDETMFRSESLVSTKVLIKKHKQFYRTRTQWTFWQTWILRGHRKSVLRNLSIVALSWAKLDMHLLVYDFLRYLCSVAGWLDSFQRQFCDCRAVKFVYYDCQKVSQISIGHLEVKHCLLLLRQDSYSAWTVNAWPCWERRWNKCQATDRA